MMIESVSNDDQLLLTVSRSEVMDSYIVHEYRRSGRYGYSLMQTLWKDDRKVALKYVATRLKNWNKWNTPEVDNNG